MTNAASLLIPFTLFTVMLALGLGLPLDALGQWRQHWRLLLRAEVATCLLVPLIGWALLSSSPAQLLSSEARHAIALMAACPSAPLILRKAGKSGGDAGLAGLLQVGAALVAILTVPLLANLGERVFGVDGWDVLPRQVALQVGQVQLLPLVLGLLLRRQFPATMERALVPLDRLANGLLVVLVVAVLVKTAPLLLGFGVSNVAALVLMALLVLLSLALGYAVAGEGPGRRVTTALVTSMRNPGLALLLASTYAPQLPGVKLGVLLYVLVTVLVSAVALKLSKRATSIP
jgi:bile acid:Na+ symporter, BASS family